MKSVKIILLLNAAILVCAAIGCDTEKEVIELVDETRDIARDCDKITEDEWPQRKSKLMESHEQLTAAESYRAFSYSIDRRTAADLADERFKETKCSSCKLIADDFKHERKRFRILSKKLDQPDITIAELADRPDLQRMIDQNIQERLNAKRKAEILAEQERVAQSLLKHTSKISRASKTKVQCESVRPALILWKGEKECKCDWVNNAIEDLITQQVERVNEQPSRWSQTEVHALLLRSISDKFFNDDYFGGALKKINETSDENEIAQELEYIKSYIDSQARSKIQWKR